MNTCCSKCRKYIPSALGGVNDLVICSNHRCECHSYEQSGSHYHCWDQKQETPDCGIPKDKHRRCCLCPRENPKYESDFEKFVKENPKCTICNKPIEDKVSGGSLSLDSKMRGPWHIGCSPVEVSKPDWETQIQSMMNFPDPRSYIIGLVRSLLASHEASTRKAVIEEILKEVEGMKQDIYAYPGEAKDALDSIRDILKNKIK